MSIRSLAWSPAFCVAVLCVLPAHAQTDSEVVQPVGLEYELPHGPAKVEASLATELEPLAWMAALAYCNAEPPSLVAPADNCNQRIAESALAMQGWKELQHHSSFLQGYGESMSNLAFTVYGRRSSVPDTVDLAIAFRGSTGNGADWKSNFRWVLRVLPGADHYNIVASRADEIIERSIASARKQIQDTDKFRLLAVGHSLGGGLAQLMAYRVNRPNVTVAAVAFDTTVVTGYITMVSDEQVNCRVPIWRVEERGEFLAPVRAVFREFYRWDENIRRVKYNFQHNRNAFSQHSIHRLARSITREVDQQPAGARSAALAFAHLFEPRTDCTCEFRRKGLPWLKVRDLASCSGYGAEATASSLPQ